MIILLILVSCGAGISDDLLDIGGKFYLLRGGAGYGGVIYYSKSEKDKIEHEILSFGVEEVDFDTNFIIIKRNYSKVGLKQIQIVPLVDRLYNC